MKVLSNEEKLRIMNEGVEPFVRTLSPEIVASCIASMLKVYMDSPIFNNEEIEAKASTVLSAGLAMDLLSYLMVWYED